ncbi:hypothetical protein [Cyanobium sp. ATX-6F1]|uniref:hypothetical protein n=1 Tax=Cyanobium sp. ATX-6F1 TaxID=3137388 RepID=UPI0039BE79F6
MELSRGGSIATASVLKIGASDVSLFIGTGGPYASDSNADGSIDLATETNANAVGFAITDVDLALAILQDADATPGTPTTKYIGLRASGAQAGLVGTSDFGVDFGTGAITIELNIASGGGATAASEVVNFASLGDGDGLVVKTSTSTEQVLDFEERRIHVGANDVLVNLGGFAYLNGNLSFDLGSRTSVIVNSGIPSSVLSAIESSGLTLSEVAATINGFLQELEETDPRTLLRTKFVDAVELARTTLEEKLMSLSRQSRMN